VPAECGPKLADLARTPPILPELATRERHGSHTAAIRQPYGSHAATALTQYAYRARIGSKASGG
jgi:hypothetical protein